MKIAVLGTGMVGSAIASKLVEVALRVVWLEEQQYH
jgi:3-hydroxyisobutyrate dehydrogenase-like beta-hydroxyacid dehydrogenase